MNIYYYNLSNDSYRIEKFENVNHFFMALRFLVIINRDVKSIAKTINDSSVIDAFIKFYSIKPDVVVIEHKIYEAIKKHSKPEDLAKLRLVGIT